MDPWHYKRSSTEWRGDRGEGWTPGTGEDMGWGVVGLTNAREPPISGTFCAGNFDMCGEL